jgi:hypothetical protein
LLEGLAGAHGVGAALLFVPQGFPQPGIAAAA